MNAFFYKLTSLFLSLFFGAMGLLGLSCDSGKWQLDGIPAYTGGVVCENIYDAGAGRESDWQDASAENNNYMQIIRGSSLCNVKAYCDTLQDAGFSLVFENRIEDNFYYCFHNGEKQVYLSYCDDTKEVRVMDDSCSDRPDSFGYTSHEGETATVWQFGFPYYDADFNSDDTIYSRNGMLYVVRLADNKLLVIDGGSILQSSDANVEAFMAFLREITGTAPGETIRVALWYGTHGHSDHISFFSKVLCKYSDVIEIERFMYNYWSYAVCDYNHRVDWFREQTAILYPDAQYLKVRGGYKCRLANIGMEVLYTHEDAVSARNGRFTSDDGNDGSSILKLTIADKTFLFLGDAAAVTQTELLRRFTAETLSADVVQASHHMLNYLKKLYAEIEPTYVLAPQSRHRSVTSCEAYNILRAHTAEENFFFASEGTYGLTPDGGGNMDVTARPMTCGAYDGSDIVYDFLER